MVYQVKGTKTVQFEEEKQQKPKYRPKGEAHPESDGPAEEPDTKEKPAKAKKNKQKNGNADLKKSNS